MKTKSISNNVMECNVFLSMGTLEKVYPHWVYWMAIDGMGQNNIYYIGEIQLGAQCWEEDIKGHTKWQDD